MHAIHIFGALEHHLPGLLYIILGTKWADNTFQYEEISAYSSNVVRDILTKQSS